MSSLVFDGRATPYLDELEQIEQIEQKEEELYFLTLACEKGAVMVESEEEKVFDGGNPEEREPLFFKIESHFDKLGFTKAEHAQQRANWDFFKKNMTSDQCKKLPALEKGLRTIIPAEPSKDASFVLIKTEVSNFLDGVGSGICDPGRNTQFWHLLQNLDSFMNCSIPMFLAKLRKSFIEDIQAELIFEAKNQHNSFKFERAEEKWIHVIENIQIEELVQQAMDRAQENQVLAAGYLFDKEWEIHFNRFLCERAKNRSGWYLGDDDDAFKDDGVKYYQSLLNRNAQFRDFLYEKFDSKLNNFYHPQRIPAYLDSISKGILDRVQSIVDFSKKPKTKGEEKEDQAAAEEKQEVIEIGDAAHIKALFGGEDSVLQLGLKEGNELDPLVIVDHAGYQYAQRSQDEIKEALKIYLVEKGFLFKNKYIQNFKSKENNVEWFIQPNDPYSSYVRQNNTIIYLHELKNSDLLSSKIPCALFPYSPEQAAHWKLPYFPAGTVQLAANIKAGNFQFKKIVFEGINFDAIENNVWEKIQFQDCSFEGDCSISCDKLIWLCATGRNVSFIPKRLRIQNLTGQSDIDKIVTGFYVQREKGLQEIELLEKERRSKSGKLCSCSHSKKTIKEEIDKLERAIEKEKQNPASLEIRSLEEKLIDRKKALSREQNHEKELTKDMRQLNASIEEKKKHFVSLERIFNVMEFFIFNQMDSAKEKLFDVIKEKESLKALLNEEQKEEDDREERKEDFARIIFEGIEKEEPYFEKLLDVLLGHPDGAFEIWKLKSKNNENVLEKILDVGKEELFWKKYQDKKFGQFKKVFLEDFRRLDWRILKKFSSVLIRKIKEYPNSGKVLEEIISKMMTEEIPLDLKFLALFEECPVLLRCLKKEQMNTTGAKKIQIDCFLKDLEREKFLAQEKEKNFLHFQWGMVLGLIVVLALILVPFIIWLLPLLLTTTTWLIGLVFFFISSISFLTPFEVIFAAKKKEASSLLYGFWAGFLYPFCVGLLSVAKFFINAIVLVLFWSISFLVLALAMPIAFVYFCVHFMLDYISSANYLLSGEQGWLCKIIIISLALVIGLVVFAGVCLFLTLAAAYSLGTVCFYFLLKTIFTAFFQPVSYSLEKIKNFCAQFGIPVEVKTPFEWFIGLFEEKDAGILQKQFSSLPSDLKESIEKCGLLDTLKQKNVLAFIQKKPECSNRLIFLFKAISPPKGVSWDTWLQESGIRRIISNFMELEIRHAQEMGDAQKRTMKEGLFRALLTEVYFVPKDSLENLVQFAMTLDTVSLTVLYKKLHGFLGENYKADKWQTWSDAIRNPRGRKRVGEQLLQEGLEQTYGGGEPDDPVLKENKFYLNDQELADWAKRMENTSPENREKWYRLEREKCIQTVRHDGKTLWTHLRELSPFSDRQNPSSSPSPSPARLG